MGVTRPLPALRLVLVIGGALLLLAGLELYIFSTRTDEFFAWTIASSLDAAVEGAFYFAAFVLTVLILRAHAWAEIRPVAYGVLVVTVVKLLATLLDLDPFHFEGPETAAQISSWTWLVAYTLVPSALLVLAIAQERAPGTDPARGPPLPRSLAGALGILAVVMPAIGAVLLLSPSLAEDIWPWTLTPLTSHSLSAWFLGIGVLLTVVVRTNDRSLSRSIMAATALLAVLLAVALARYESQIAWERAMAWVLVGLIALMAFSGIYGLLAAREPARRPGVAASS